uniref:DUS-like FMN-binding domain-containing protein n=1 Tax=Entomoneis paludosa TaxID=265537 RepID=A0A7S2YQ01_9STRA|mmetsp:Transcript_5103/g.10800  ORF Transcript_5103/g.10800 Transcript_5103/m.10800 type:complete len:289 (+) Transcript_5103:92-958(+)
MESDNGETVCNILTALRNHLPSHVAVSAKIRLPLEEDQLKPRIQSLMATGIDFLAVHGRTLKENKTAVRASHSTRIREAVQIAQAERPNFPMVANGGIEIFPDVERVRLETGTAAIMSSEGLLETPQLFRNDVSQLNPRQRLEEQFQIARDYLHWTALYPPFPGVLGNVAGPFNIAKGHLFKFLHPYLQDHRDVMLRLAAHDINRLVDAQRIVDELYARYQDCSDEDLHELESSKVSSSWYRRHWGSIPAQRKANAPVLSVEDRKKALQKRIEKLRDARKAKAAASLP